MEKFVPVMLVAALIERVVESLKPTYAKLPFAADVTVPLSLVVGILVCALSGVDLFGLAGVPLSVPYAGSILTGMILAGGSAVVNAVVEALKSIRG